MGEGWGFPGKGLTVGPVVTAQHHMQAVVVVVLAPSALTEVQEPAARVAQVRHLQLRDRVLRDRGVGAARVVVLVALVVLVVVALALPVMWLAPQVQRTLAVVVAAAGVTLLLMNATAALAALVSS